MPKLWQSCGKVLLTCLHEMFGSMEHYIKRHTLYARALCRHCIPTIPYARLNNTEYLYLVRRVGATSELLKPNLDGLLT